MLGRIVAAWPGLSYQSSVWVRSTGLVVVLHWTRVFVMVRVAVVCFLSSLVSKLVLWVSVVAFSVVRLLAPMVVVLPSPLVD